MRADARPRRAPAAAIGGVMIAAMVLAITGPASAEPYVDGTTRVSAATDGTPGNGGSYQPTISADGRYIAYASSASNLVAGDTNATSDVFLTDTTTGTTTLISTHTDGTLGNGFSTSPAISADGRFITYFSAASTLVTGDTNGALDVFLTDATTGTTTLISTHTDGTPGNGGSLVPAISADGRYVTYHSSASNLVTGDINAASDVFLTDTTTGTTTLISTHTDGTPGNGGSTLPGISADGRYITYLSFASNLVAGDTNAASDVFLTDTTTGTTTLINTHTDGTRGNGFSTSPAISADGRYVTYDSYASNLITGDTNAESDVFLTHVGSAPAVVTHPADASVTVGDTATFTAAFTAATSIQWQTAPDPTGPWTDIPGATTTTLDVDTTTAGTSYIRSTATNPGGTVATDPATLTVTVAAPTVVTHPTNASVTVGDTATFTAAFTAAATIQWQTAPDPTGPWTDIPGATTTTLDVAATTAGTSYIRSTATNPGGTVATDSATLTVTVALAAAPSMANTGLDPTAPLTVGVLLVLLGTAASLTRRRARKAPESYPSR